MSVLIVIVGGTIKYTLISDDVVPFGGATTPTRGVFTTRIRVMILLARHYTTFIFITQLNPKSIYYCSKCKRRDMNGSF